MYATEETYVIAYLAISLGICAGAHRATYHSDQYQLRAHHYRSQLKGGMPVLGASHLEGWHRLVQTIEHLD